MAIREVFVKSGATYDLHLVAAADHKLDDINVALQRSEGRSIQQAAVRFIGLDGESR